jgi:hypothetical protein
MIPTPYFMSRDSVYFTTLNTKKPTPENSGMSFPLYLYLRTKARILLTNRDLPPPHKLTNFC